MKTLAKVLPGILALAFLGLGLIFMFNPAATLGRLGVTLMAWTDGPIFVPSMAVSSWV
ncbi:MAG: hypothetical protein AAF702_10990 [Chloroflexota bacterium]